MNIVFLKLYITNEVNDVFYNSQEMGMARALVKAHPEHHVDIVLLSRTVSARQDAIVASKGRDESGASSGDDRIVIHTLPGKGIGHHGIIDLDILRELKADLVHLLADNMLYAPKLIDYCLENNIKCHLYIGTLFTDSSDGLKQTISKLMLGWNIRAYKKVPVYAKTPYVQKQLNAQGVMAKLAPVGLPQEGLKVSDRDIYEIREHYGMPFNVKILLFVGRLEEYKRPIEAVELLKNLNDSGGNYHLLMIGDGVMASELDTRVKELGLQGSVRRIPKIPNSEMAEIYKACDFFINFNRVEIYGMAILEAMVGFCPVLAMRAPGPEFLIDDGKTGFLCDSETEMRKKIALLSKDDNLRQEITGNAREHVVKDLTWDKTIEVFEDWK
ncbi:glycosyltransferase family 4 protein [Butyrivibrio sp. AE2032]|uniref:glycosyltransferase family 4 protein n=1 Tax=Butyrivibrio sp. AE2032 TaxID=1458463 RepID=UPI0005587239|nr:glycosyltransferase [Butyrivibrio sp. AE2032]